MMLADSHALVWWLSPSPLLSKRARRALDTAVREGPVHASALSILEIATAVRRGRLDLGIPVEEWLHDLRTLPYVRIEPVSAEIACLAGSFASSVHGDPVDRVILATARILGLKLVTSDERLRRSQEVETVW